MVKFLITDITLNSIVSFLFFDIFPFPVLMYHLTIFIAVKKTKFNIITTIITLKSPTSCVISSVYFNQWIYLLRTPRHLLQLKCQSIATFNFALRDFVFHLFYQSSTIVTLVIFEVSVNLLTTLTCSFHSIGHPSFYTT